MASMPMMEANPWPWGGGEMLTTWSQADACMRSMNASASTGPREGGGGGGDCVAHANRRPSAHFERFQLNMADDFA